MQAELIKIWTGKVASFPFQRVKGIVTHWKIILFITSYNLLILFTLKF
jgi:hypothetical protein